MNVKEALWARRSCRAFGPDKVEREVLIDILANALRAPSWADSQPWEIYVAEGETLKGINRAYLKNAEEHVPINPDMPRPQGWPADINARIKAAMSGLAATATGHEPPPELNRGFFHAPAVIYLCMDKSLSSWSVFDMGALSQSIMLAAAEKGLSTMPAVTLVQYPDILRQKLDIPENLMVVFGIAIGRADEGHPINAFKSPRRELSEVVKIKG